MGRADRNAGKGSRLRHQDADGVPQGRRTQHAVSPRRQAVPGQGLPQGQGVLAAEAQPADRHQAQGSRRCQGPGTRRVAVRAAANWRRNAAGLLSPIRRRSGSRRQTTPAESIGMALSAPTTRVVAGASTAGVRSPSTARRRAAANNAPWHARVADDDEHIGRNWFRRSVWYPACAAADLGMAPRVHDLRHAHASWLLAGGADLQVVKERLGHASIATTEKYLHSLPTADETALDALTKIRNPRLARSA